MPVHPDLAEILAASQHTAPTFLVTACGKPSSVAGFRNWFRDRCNEAARPHRSTHGLRKAMAARLAKRGATAKEIMAIAGHQSLDEVEVYMRQANNAKLASRNRVSHRSAFTPTVGTNSEEE